MYVAAILLLMVVLPIVSIGNEHYLHHASTPLMLLAGKWFAFWSAGIRLFTAGLRQLLQPRFTVEAIFGIRSDDPLPFVRELGIANIASGTVGILSIVQQSFVLPAANRCSSLLWDRRYPAPDRQAEEPDARAGNGNRPVRLVRLRRLCNIHSSALIASSGRFGFVLRSRDDA